MHVEPTFRRIGMKYNTYRKNWKSRLKLKSGSCALWTSAAPKHWEMLLQDGGHGQGAFLVKHVLILKLCAANKQVSYCWSWNSGGLITSSVNLADEREEMKLATW